MRYFILWLLLLQVTLLRAQDTLQLPAHRVPAIISRGEYFFDADPGFGYGTAFSGPVTGSSVSFVRTGSIAALTAGVHSLHVRLRDSAGCWSLTGSRFLYIVDTLVSFPPHASPGTLTRLEYFTDTDPGFGNGTAITLPPSATAAITNIPVDISSLANGVHTVNFRFRNSSGAWSQTTTARMALVSVSVDLPAHPAADSIYTLEYFFDADPGIGQGIQLNVPAAVQLDNYIFQADISGLNDGIHRLFIRSLHGPSLTAMHSFTIGQPLPVQLLSFTVRQQGEDALLSWKIADETGIQGFIAESGTDGITFQALGSITAQHQNGYIYTYADPYITRHPAQKIYYRLRTAGIDGGFSYTPVVSLDLNGGHSVAYPNPFRDEIRVVPATQLDDRFPVSISIVDAAGRCVYEGHVRPVRGQVLISGGTLPAGNYWLSLEAGSYREVFRLTKQ